MNCQDIEEKLKVLKVDSAGRLRNKNKAIDSIHAQHLTEVDNTLMDIRVFIARLSTGLTSKDAFKKIDDFIYNKQIN